VSELEPMSTNPEHEEKKPRRRRLFWIGGSGILLIAAVVCFLFWATSAGFEDLVRKRIVAQIETATGGRVELASFHWHLISLEAEASGLVIHGREAAGEAPYAQIDHLHVGISVLGLMSPRILVRDLEITRPAFHLIVYPDGTTNQPRPRNPRKPSKPAMDTLFDFKAGHVAVEQGTLDYENRAADFDSQSRRLPLDFSANDVSTLLSYTPANGKSLESYRIAMGARDLHLTRGTASKPVALPIEGYLQATLDLTRNAAYLQSLHLTASGKNVPERTLSITGSLQDFSRPHWQATVQGNLDMRLLEPMTGYANSPEGLARLNLGAEGNEGQFRVDGTVHVDNGSYVDPGVDARGVNLDAHVHADPEQLLITSVVARLRQGGQLEGSVALDHWIQPIPGGPVLEATAPVVKKRRFGKSQAPLPRAMPVVTAADVITIPVNGKVVAQLKGLTLDTVLDIVGKGPFERLGIDGHLNGPATATWVKGDVQTLSVDARLSVSPSPRPVPGEAPATGVIDGIYTQHDGAVELQALTIDLPSSHIDAHGHLGAYPLSSASALNISFDSHNLSDFDRVLRDLGFTHEGKAGTAALPASISGGTNFEGTWEGSLDDPHLAGTLKATNLSVELPPAHKAQKPQSVHLDAVNVTGSYSATRISIDHGQLTNGASAITIEGSLAAAAPSPSGAGTPNFDADSLLHLHVVAGKVSAGELLPLLGQSLPVTGELNAQFQTDGPIHALDGSGWVELDRGIVYDEPIARIRAQGRIAGRAVQLSSITLNDQAGGVTASGSYDLQSHQFQINAQGAGIDVSRIHRLQNAGMDVTGMLGFQVNGSGTLDDPRLQARGTLTDLTLSGEQVGSLEMTAHTAEGSMLYDLSTHFASASFSAHGQTVLKGDYATQAKIDFSQFNIAALLKMAHIPGLTGESQLAGTVTVDGPFARPEQMRGDARLQAMEVTVAGVHLRSEGPVHAALANSRITLDPLQVTGEQTDLHAHGTLDLKANRQLDFAANGSINMKLAETLDPDLTASGTTTFQVEAHGPLHDPGLRGRIDFQDASLALEDLPNSLSQLHGTLEFNQNRLEVKSLTAMTGGGQLSVSGYLAYQRGIFADLSVSGKGIRIRYPQGVSSLADADLHLQGGQNNLLLSGGVMITRFSVSPDLDVAGLATQATKVQPVASPDAPSNHIRLDVHIQSSPQLNFQNAYAKLAGDVDLHLRGTLATPSLLGRVSITEGSATIAGTRYELQRGDITFTNPVRIEPSIDLNATARVEDYDITLGLHGSLEKPSVTYRSDPPLPEADVVALLALGRTQNEQQIYGQQQEQVAANPTTEALLGGALNATVSSRVQKLFGAGSVKVDPNYLGVLGNSTTRITVEEQLGKNLTLTYATDVNTTAQQLLQAEIAINRHVSLLVARDESGVFSMVVKATRRYR
jgi:translocation and assembly module TamB